MTPGEPGFTPATNPDGSPVMPHQAPRTGGRTQRQTTAITANIQTIEREAMPATKRMLELLNGGDLILGFGANQRLIAARLLAETGNRDAQREVAATEEYQNVSGTLRVALAKSLGSNPSNADVALLAQITAGNITQSGAALIATVTQARSRATQHVLDLQDQLGDEGGSGAPSQADIEAEIRRRGL